MKEEITELNEEVKDILLQFATILQKEKLSDGQILGRCVYDSFRIQHILDPSEGNITELPKIDSSKIIKSK